MVTATSGTVLWPTFDKSVAFLRSLTFVATGASFLAGVEDNGRINGASFVKSLSDKLYSCNSRKAFLSVGKSSGIVEAKVLSVSFVLINGANPLEETAPNWFILVEAGGNWLILADTGPNWFALVEAVPNWFISDESGVYWLVVDET